MKRSVIRAILTACVAWLAFGQLPEDAPKFQAADIHPSPKNNSPMGQFGRALPVRAGRYDVRNANMVDLIRIAYGFDSDKVLGGPNWLELDRFDIAAKVPPDSTPEMHKQMLQSLLQDRFKLVVRKETKPLPTYALVAGKKPQLKEAEGSEQTGCRPKSASGPAGPGVMRLTMGSFDGGAPVSITIGPGGTIDYNCRNISMDAFVANMRSMLGASVGNNPVLNETGLKGNWNFDLTYSMTIFGPMGQDNAPHISFANAVEKQLGLKLEDRQVPTPVIVVESVKRRPADNPPGTADVLPPLAAPTEFEVASVKLSDSGGRGGRYQMQPGGRLVVENMPLRFVLQRAFNTFNNESIVGIPGFVDSERFDIMAKAGAVGVPLTNADMDAVAPMLLSLLKERFGLKYHTEDRPVTAYTLVATKPKLKKADPEARTSCKNTNAPAPASPGTRTLSCQNITMEQFVERLQGIGPDLSWPVADGTGLEGGWDLSVTFNQRMMMAMPIGMAGGRGAGGDGGGEGGPAGSAMPTASDPTDGYTLFEALEKQLGLKLEKQKRPMPVIVIDHIEQKPTEN